MQDIGTQVLKFNTCTLPRLLPMERLDCREEEEEALVLVSAAKGGSVFAAKFALDVGRMCGICVGSGSRSRSGVTSFLLSTHGFSVEIAVKDFDDFRRNILFDSTKTD